MKQRWLSVLGGLGLATYFALGLQAQTTAGTNSVRQASAMSFLTRIRIADPDYRIVLMACLKGSELNLLLSRQVTNEEMPVIAKGLVAELAKALPGESLSVVLFRPVVPLRESGIARLDIDTGKVEYTAVP